MTYAKFDDRCPEHPKIAALTDREFRAWFEMVCYCARNLTDGQIVDVIARRQWGKVLPSLQAAGVVEARGTNYAVHDYLDWNDSREEVQRRIERARKGGRGKAASSTAWSSASGNASSNGASSASSPAQTPAIALPSAPLRSTDPDRTSGLGSSGEATSDPDNENATSFEQVQAKFSEHLTPDQTHNLARLVDENRAFLNVWPEAFDAFDPGVVSEALMRARTRDVGVVDRPRAWLEALLAEVQTEFAGPLAAPLDAVQETA